MNLVLRVMSGVILAPIVLYLVFIGGIWLEALCCLAVFISAHELSKMAFPQTKYLALLAFLGLLFFIGLINSSNTVSCLLLVMGLCAGGGLATLSTRSESSADILNRYFIVFSFAYVSLGIASLLYLRRLDFSVNYGRDMVFLLLFATWANDIFAYFFGRAFGKNKLAEHISKGKTWEGFFGGALFGALIPLLIWWCLQNYAGIALAITIGDILAVSLPIALLGPAGDLVESRMKRVYGVKDSGSILPGHGGVLDRIDALLISGPWTLFYAIFSHY